jgi:SpoU rRNA methylase family enzyme
MYEAYRELNPHSNKEVSVFEDIESALAWLCPDLQLATD